jgi:3-dehydroquinate synthase
MIGAFYQPRCVIADTSVLHSLQPRELGAGLAEVIKYGLVADAEFFDWLETSMVNLGDGDRFALGRAIRRSCEIKAEVVAEDERESGIRAILNFGHTFAHAIEMLTEYRTLLHGEAVAIGMVMAADLSARQGLTSWNEARRIRQVIAGFGLPVQPPTLASEDMLGAMGMDKKIVDGALRLVLLKSVGRAVVTQEIDPAALRETLTAADSLCNG